MSEDFQVRQAAFLRASVRADDVEMTQMLPQIAFLGRSNVGKSSLLNMLAARQSLVRVSRTPGATRSLNVFQLQVAHGATTRPFYFLDMPGYGFAQMSKEEKAKSSQMLSDYLRRIAMIIASSNPSAASSAVTTAISAANSVVDSQKDVDKSADKHTDKNTPSLFPTLSPLVGSSTSTPINPTAASSTGTPSPAVPRTAPFLVCHLVDMRHDPSQDDLHVRDLLSMLALPRLVIATKADKLVVSKRAPARRALAKALSIDVDLVIPTSADLREGRGQVWKSIWQRTA